MLIAMSAVGTIAWGGAVARLDGDRAPRGVRGACTGAWAGRNVGPLTVTSMRSLRGARRRSRGHRRVLEWVVVVGAALLVAVLVRTFALAAYYIPSGSMMPTIEVHDRILVDKLFFSWHAIHEGEIVVFHRPATATMCADPGENTLVKRVVALPGQSLYSVGDSLYVNGRRLVEPYLPKTGPLGVPIPGATPTRPFRVPAGEFFVMGDNRSDSCDSRYWGPIKGSSVIGEAILRWWHNGRPDFTGL